MIESFKNHLRALLLFLKAPNDNFLKDKELSIPAKWREFFILFVVAVFLNILALGILSSLQSLSVLTLKSDKIEAIFRDMNPFALFLLISILAPLIEEVIFRLPLNYKRNYLFHFIGWIIGREKVKSFWHRYFSFFFYAFCIAFAYIHLSNYQNHSILFYLLSPLVVLPQFCGGIVMSYMRIKLGFIWGFMAHASFNGVLLLLALSFPTEIISKQSNGDFALTIEEVLVTYGKGKQLNIHREEANISSLEASNYKINDILEKLNYFDYQENTEKIYNIKLIISNPKISADSLLISELSKLN